MTPIAAVAQTKWQWEHHSSLAQKSPKRDGLTQYVVEPRRQRWGDRGKKKRYEKVCENEENENVQNIAN